MHKNLIETAMGAVVLVVAGFFLVFAYNTAGMHEVSGYQVTAKFNKVDGLSRGAEVRLAGIKVGTIVNQVLDLKDYNAVVTMTIEPDVKLTADTTAKITSDGLLGDKYVSLEIGADEDYIKSGGQISYTQGSVDLMDMVGRLIFSTTGSKDKKDVPKDLQ